MTLYDDDSECKELLRSFMALALLPIDSIHEGYELLKRKARASVHKEQLRLFISYFDNEWMHTFHPSTWLVCKKTWRTNNFAEGK